MCFSGESLSAQILYQTLLVIQAISGHRTTEGASTLPIAQVKGLKNTCHCCLVVFASITLIALYFIKRQT
jgi:hypothetical protein